MGERLGRALCYDGAPGALREVVAALPVSGAGETLVAVETALVCGSDLHTIDGRRSAPTPLVLGHETVGIVREAPGAGPGGLRPGDRVVWGIVAHCGSCAVCASGFPQKCPDGLKFGHARAEGDRLWSGGYAQAVLLPAGTTVLRVPDAVPSHLAALAACTTATACAVVEAAQTVDGAQVVVNGAGALGLQTALLCRHLGAARVLCVDPDAARRAAIRALGLDAVAPGGEVGEVDVYLELAGDGSGFAQVQPRLTLGARVVLAGAVFPTAPLALDMERLIRACARVQGVHNYRPEHLAQALAFLEAHTEALSGVLRFAPLRPLSDWREVLEDARSGSWHRAGFAPTSSSSLPGSAGSPS